MTIYETCSWLLLKWKSKFFNNLYLFYWSLHDSIFDSCYVHVCFHFPNTSGAIKHEKKYVEFKNSSMVTLKNLPSFHDTTKSSLTSVVFQVLCLFQTLFIVNEGNK